MKRILWVILFLVVGLSLAVGAGSVMDRIGDNRIRAEAEALRDEVRHVRAELNRCLDEMEIRERAFREQEEATSVLRSRVEAYEAQDDRGVPADQYTEYLETFDEYNESLPEWEERGEALREVSTECRELARRHNFLADSLSSFLVQQGLWEEAWVPGGHPSPGGDPSSDGG
jgi:predicted  nucleic acid-binding Zn-ribbon protein